MVIDFLTGPQIPRGDRDGHGLREVSDKIRQENHIEGFDFYYAGNLNMSLINV